MSRGRSKAPPGQGSLFGGEPPPSGAPLDVAELFGLSDEQRAALELAASRVIGASAGTGKTHTLTAIYMGLLTGQVKADAPPGGEGSSGSGLRPSQIVAVTFTEKAAAELAERVRGAIEKVLAAPLEPAMRAHLLQCREDLPGAPISTIHSFCRKLLAEAGLREGLPPGFGVLEDEEAKELFTGALLEAAAERLERDAHPELADLARAWNLKGYGGLDRGLTSVGRRLIDELRTHGWTPEVLLDGDDDGNWTAEVREQFEAAFAAIREVPDKGRSKPGPELRDLVAAEPDCADHQAALRLVHRVYELICGSGKSPLKWAEKAGVAPFLERALWLLYGPYRRALTAYVTDAWARYGKVKRDAGMLDFDDLMLEARELLKAEPELVERFRFVLIDEFQDTNPLQKDLLFRVAFPPDGQGAVTPVRVAVVGDEKQSIYRFRGADVSGMREARETFESVSLTGNYRSRRAVLEWINGICREAVWPPQGAGFIAYDERHALTPGADGARHAWQAPAGEVLEPGEALSDVNAEGQRWLQAQTLARRIRTLVAPSEAADDADGALVTPVLWDREQNVARASVRYGDIAIIARNLKKIRVPLELALVRMGIPFRMMGGISFYTRPEILDVINLLACAADPEDAAALWGFFRGPWAQLSDGALFTLMYGSADGAVASTERPIERLVSRVAEKNAADLSTENARKFLDAVALLHALQARNGCWTAAEMIDLACRRTGFLSVLAMQPQGEVAVAAVRRLIERTRQYEAHGARTLRDLVAWLREQADAEWDDPGRKGGPDLGPDLPENQDAVQIGTIHSAKGLEFPITIVADIGFTRPPGSSDAQFSQVHGLGLKLGLRDGGFGSRADAAHAQLSEEDKQAEAEESKRLLYVALTRARDYLILCGEKGRGKGSWRELLDLHEENADEQRRLVRVPYDHPALQAAQPDANRAPLRFAEGVARLDAGTPAPEDEARPLKAMLNDYSAAPARAAGPSPVEAVPVSTLARFLSCPRRFAWSAVVAEAAARSTGDADAADGGATSREARDEGYAYDAEETVRALGTAAHAGLEAVFRQGAAEPFEAAFDAALTAEGGRPDRAEAGRTRARLRAWLDGRWAQTALAQPSARRFAERAFRWRAPAGGGTLLLTGTMDLLLGDGGGWQLIDYKLTSLDHARQSGPAREALRRYVWQVGLYAKVAARILELPPEQVQPCLLFLSDAPAAPTPLAKLPLSEPAKALDDASVEVALGAYFAASQRARIEEFPCVVYVPGEGAPRPRTRALCEAEGCPFVARCFE